MLKEFLKYFGIEFSKIDGAKGRKDSLNFIFLLINLSCEVFGLAKIDMT